MGRLLRDEQVLPDMILSSTAARALGTATLVAQASGHHGELRTLPELYLAEVPVYLQVIRALDDRHARVMLVGHNPGLEELLATLTGADARMPTAALAHVRFDLERWADVDAGRGALLRIWRPKEL